jgi:hypothetical protein
VLKWLDWNAFHDLESNTHLHLKKALQVLSALLSKETDEAERIAGLMIDKYLTILQAPKQK